MFLCFVCFNLVSLDSVLFYLCSLPGTGIPSGSDSGLHGTSRRRDSSVPERSRLRTSESGASAGESRPSLFDGLSSGFSPFGPQEVFHLETMLRL